uniref:Uncharacterized protein n=1 Tax=viral metagenome TaxID=1070528 RepID=A0A6C0H5M5_9ZZZZ
MNNDKNNSSLKEDIIELSMIVLGIKKISEINLNKIVLNNNLPVQKKLAATILLKNNNNSLVDDDGIELSMSVLGIEDINNLNLNNLISKNNSLYQEKLSTIILLKQKNKNKKRKYEEL